MITIRHALAALALPASLVLSDLVLAQEDEVTISDEAIEAAIRAFNERNNRSESKDTVIVLDPPADGHDDEDSDGSTDDDDDSVGKERDQQQDDTSDAPSDDGSQPVLVTGKQPIDSSVIDITDIPVIPEDGSDVPLAEPEPRPGLEVRVKNLRPGSGDFDTANVRLRFPFPAKPLIPPPSGWRLETSKEVPPFKRDVELSPGRSITLTIHPHVLVPDADGSTLFAIPEPGFQASLGYQQSDTVAGVLSGSIEKLDADSKLLGNVIDQLQQLIVSLPNPATTAPADAGSPTP